MTATRSLLNEEELLYRDWRYEVANGETYAGFEDWKKHQREIAADDEQFAIDAWISVQHESRRRLQDASR